MIILESGVRRANNRQAIIRRVITGEAALWRRFTRRTAIWQAITRQAVAWRTPQDVAGAADLASEQRIIRKARREPRITSRPIRQLGLHPRARQIQHAV